MEPIYFNSFYVAGFAYYSGVFIFNQLSIGSPVKVMLDDDNHYDANAVKLLFNGNKIGYIPRDKNPEVAALLKAGHDIFDGAVQQISPDEHPEKQVRVVLFLNSEKT